MLKISTCVNGFIAEYQLDGVGPAKIVFEFDDIEEDSEVRAFARLLKFIDAQIGPTTTRYSSARIHISVRPGDKCEVTEND